VRCARAGEKAALEELMVRCRGRVQRLARIRMGRRVRAFLDSGDVVQETLMVAAQNLDGFEPRSEGAVIQWLSKILENRIRNAATYARAEKRAPDRVRRFSSLAPDDRDGGGGALPPAGGPTPSRIAAADEMQELYDRAVSELRPRQREVVLLHRYAGLSWSANTAQLGCPSEAAARELYRRARMELALRLERTLGEEGER